MSARDILQYRTTTPVFLGHPTDVTNENPLNTTVDGSTCSFRIYDAGKDSVIVADHTTGNTEISVSDAEDFDIGDMAEIELDNAEIHASLISDVDPTAGTITVTGLPSAASTGNRVRTRLGNEITMSEYGTPKLGTTDWGFKGTILSTHPGLKMDLEIDIEINFIGAVAGGLNRLDTIRAVVRELDLE